MSLTPPSRVVLHVGSHKTGTSTLQKFLRDNRALAENQGVRFLKGMTKRDGSEHTHNVLASFLASGAPKQIQRARDCLQTGLEPAAGLHTLFASSEEFNRFVLGRDGKIDMQAQADFMSNYMAGDDIYWDRRARFLDRVAATLDGQDVEVWITLRRPDNFCMSMYQQVVRNRAYVGTIEEFAASNFTLFQYRRLLDQWAERFKVRVFVYEDMMRDYGSAATPYLEALGLGALSPQAEQVPRVNTASHPHVIEFLRRTNYFPLDKKVLRERLGRLSAKAQDWSPAKSTVLLSPTAREAFNTRFAEDCAQIRERFSVPTPGRETLFDTKVDDDRPVYPGMSQETFERIARDLGLVEPLFF